MINRKFNTDCVKVQDNCKRVQYLLMLDRMKDSLDKLQAAINDAYDRQAEKSVQGSQNIRPNQAS